MCSTISLNLSHIEHMARVVTSQEVFQLEQSRSTEDSQFVMFSGWVIEKNGCDVNPGRSK